MPMTLAQARDRIAELLRLQPMYDAGGRVIRSRSVPTDTDGLLALFPKGVEVWCDLPRQGAPPWWCAVKDHTIIASVQRTEQWPYDLTFLLLAVLEASRPAEPPATGGGGV